MGIKDILNTLGRVELKKSENKPGKAKGQNESSKQSEVPVTANDSVEITDRRMAVEKENILASQTSIESFEHAKAILSDVLNDVDEENLLEIHGNADKIKTFLIM